MLQLTDYRATRALQICIVFVTTLAIQRGLNFTRAGWIGFAVMMIYAGFDTGASLHRTFHRFWGAIFGLFLSYVLWFIGRIDYRIILMIIPVIVFMAYFSLGKYYAYPTTFTVTLTALGADYYPSETYYVALFFFDYFRATTIALGICVVFEYFIFKKSHLTHLFYRDLQQLIVQQLNELLTLVSTKPLRRGKFLTLSVQFNARILELNAFSCTSKHDYHLQYQQFDQLQLFHATAETIYQNIRQLFVGAPTNMDNLLFETKNKLDQLNDMSHHL